MAEEENKSPSSESGGEEFVAPRRSLSRLRRPMPSEKKDPTLEAAVAPSAKAQVPPPVTPEKTPGGASAAPRSAAGGGESAASGSGASSASGTQGEAINLEIAQALLEAAQNAQKMTERSDQASAQMHHQRAGLELAAAKATRLNYITLIALSAVMFITIISFVFMNSKLSNRVDALDETILSVGERVVRMNVAFDDLRRLREEIQLAQQDQEALREIQRDLNLEFSRFLDFAEALPDLIPTAVSQRLDADWAEPLAAMQDRVVELNEVLIQQQNAMNEQGERIDSFRSSLESVQTQVQRVDSRTGSIARLERDLQALVTVTRERILENMAVTASQANIPPEGLPDPVLRYPPLPPEEPQ